MVCRPQGQPRCVVRSLSPCVQLSVGERRGPGREGSSSVIGAGLRRAGAAAVGESPLPALVRAGLGVWWGRESAKPLA